MEKKISIIVPVYNGKKTIKKAIESVINQTYKNWELIIVDDGSTDGSDKIYNEFKDRRISCFYNENKGVSFSRNYGISKATGDFIMFLDSDDFYMKNTLETCINEYENYNSLIIFYYKKIRNGELVEEKNKIEEVLLSDTFSDKYENIVKRGLFNIVWNKMFVKDIIIDNNIMFDENLNMGEDYKFNLEYMDKIEKIKIIDKYLYVYDISNDSLSTRYRADEFERRKKLYTLLENYYKKYNSNMDYIMERRITEVVNTIKNISKKETFINEEVKNEITIILKDEFTQKIQVKKNFKIKSKISAFIIKKKLNGFIFFILYLRYKLRRRFI